MKFNSLLTVLLLSLIIFGCSGGNGKSSALSLQNTKSSDSLNNSKANSNEAPVVPAATVEKVAETTESSISSSVSTNSSSTPTAVVSSSTSVSTETIIVQETSNSSPEVKAVNVTETPNVITSSSVSESSVSSTNQVIDNNTVTTPVASSQTVAKVEETSIIDSSISFINSNIVEPITNLVAPEQASAPVAAAPENSAVKTVEATVDTGVVSTTETSPTVTESVTTSASEASASPVSTTESSQTVAKVEETSIIDSSIIFINSNIVEPITNLVAPEQASAPVAETSTVSTRDPASDVISSSETSSIVDANLILLNDKVIDEIVTEIFNPNINIEQPIMLSDLALDSVATAPVDPTEASSAINSESTMEKVDVISPNIEPENTPVEQSIVVAPEECSITALPIGNTMYESESKILSINCLNGDNLAYSWTIDGNQQSSIESVINVANLSLGKHIIFSKIYNKSGTVQLSYEIEVIKKTDIDPGTGWWLPPYLSDGTTINDDVIVVDAPIADEFITPGCLKTTFKVKDCEKKDSINGTISGTGATYTLSQDKNNIVAIRYEPELNKDSDTAKVADKVVKISSLDSNSKNIVEASISSKPGDFNVDSKCKVSGNKPTINLNSTSCKLDSGIKYYLNIKNTDQCGKNKDLLSNCRFKVKIN